MDNKGNCNQSDGNNGIIPENDQNQDVPAEPRQVLELRLLDNVGFPLPPIAVYAGLHVRHHVTFSYSTLQKDLRNLSKKEDLIRISTKALKERKLEEIPREEWGERRSYYMISEQGRERLKERD